MKSALLAALSAMMAFFVLVWWRSTRVREPGTALRRPSVVQLGIGFVTDFFDTLGIGSFATTTTAFRLTRAVDDRLVPGTLNIGHALPTFVQAVIYVSIVKVELRTLVTMIAGAVAGAWLGAGSVRRWPRATVQAGMGLALAVAACILLATALGWLPSGAGALGLSGAQLLLGVGGNFLLGILMTVGIGLYAPCMILVSLLGMNPLAAFPIMMGSCAFLMPVAGLRFLRASRYDSMAAFGLTLGGIPAVLIAAFVVESLPLGAVRWLVILVVLYTAITLLAASRGPRQGAT